MRAMAAGSFGSGFGLGRKGGFVKSPGFALETLLGVRAAGGCSAFGAGFTGFAACVFSGTVVATDGFFARVGFTDAGFGFHVPVVDGLDGGGGDSSIVMVGCGGQAGFLPTRSELPPDVDTGVLPPEAHASELHGRKRHRATAGYAQQQMAPQRTTANQDGRHGTWTP